jgi:hypothetical protein
MATQARAALRFRLGPQARQDFSVCLDLLQALVALVAFLLTFRCSFSVRNLVLVALALPGLRLSLSPGYRRRVRAWLTGLWQQLRAYPAATSRPPWPAVFVCVVLPAVAVCGVSREPLVCGDSHPTLLTAASLVAGGDWDVTEYAELSRVQLNAPCSLSTRLPYFLRKGKAGIYSNYPNGMVLFALPAAGMARLLGAHFDDYGTRLSLEKWTACWVAGLCLGLFFLIALHLVEAGPAWVMTAILATGSVFYSTIGQLLWQHGGVIFWGLLALWLEFRQAQRPRSRFGLLWTLLEGIALGMVPGCRLSGMLLVLLFGLWVLLRSPRRALVLAAGCCLGYAPWALLYWTEFGNFFGVPAGQTSTRYWSFSQLGGLAGVLVSPGRGLLVYQPWLLLGLAAFIPALRRRLPAGGPVPAPRGWMLFVVVFSAAHLVLVGAWACWWGGHCWGSRLASEAVPLAALCCLRPLATLLRVVWGRRLVVAVAVLSFLMHLPLSHFRACYWDGLPPAEQLGQRVWSWSDPPFLYPFRKTENLLVCPRPGRDNPTSP